MSGGRPFPGRSVLEYYGSIEPLVLAFMLRLRVMQILIYPAAEAVPTSRSGHVHAEGISGVIADSACY